MYTSMYKNQHSFDYNPCTMVYVYIILLIIYVYIYFLLYMYIIFLFIKKICNLDNDSIRYSFIRFNVILSPWNRLDPILSTNL